MNKENKSNNLEKTWELINFCEFDKYAARSYCAIHNVDESKNLGDITKVDENELEDFNMICGGSPCQDFSISGKQKGSVWTCNDCGEEYNPLTVHWSKRNCCPKCGSKDINKTRSSLLVEYLRVIRANHPNFGIYENVKNIVGKKFKETFNMFVTELEGYGYNLYYKVLNAKDYGIPQNRERVYLIFIRKDLDNGKFKFPEPFDNGLRLKDMLEENVDEKFYIPDEKTTKFITNLNMDILDKTDNDSPKFMGNVNREDFGGGYAGSVWDDKCVSPTLTTMQGGGRQPHVITGIDKSYNKPELIDVANCITSREDRGISNRKSEETAILENPDYSYCIDSNYYKGTTVEQHFKKHRRQLIFDNKIRIRKLTPKECFRLMGFPDEAFDAAQKAGISNSQLYKQAGNSIVTDVLYYIYVELYKAMPCLFDDLKLSSFFSGIGAFECSLDRLYKNINSGNFTNPGM